MANLSRKFSASSLSAKVNRLGARSRAESESESKQDESRFQQERDTALTAEALQRVNDQPGHFSSYGAAQSSMRNSHNERSSDSGIDAQSSSQGGSAIEGHMSGSARGSNSSEGASSSSWREGNTSTAERGFCDQSVSSQKISLEAALDELGSEGTAALLQGATVSKGQSQTSTLSRASPDGDELAQKSASLTNQTSYEMEEGSSEVLKTLSQSSCLTETTGMGESYASGEAGLEGVHSSNGEMHRSADAISQTSTMQDTRSDMQETEQAAQENEAAEEEMDMGD